MLTFCGFAVPTLKGKTWVPAKNIISGLLYSDTLLKKCRHLLQNHLASPNYPIALFGFYFVSNTPCTTLCTSFE